MVGFARVLFAVMAMAVAVAAPAGADQNDYLHLLLPKYAYLDSQQLLTEGAKVCSITRSGRPASDAVAIVQKDLGELGVPSVSLSAAGEIVAAALVYLDC